MSSQFERLTLLDLSDRELLLVLRDTADGQGYALAQDIADRIGIVGDHPSRSVSVRLSWLARYGAVEREHERDAHGQIRYHRNGKAMHTQRWRMTQIGMMMATGKLNKSQEAALDRLGDGQMLMTMRWLTQRVVGSDRTVSKLMDREYRYGVGRR